MWPMHYVFSLSGQPSHTYFAWHNISLLSVNISMKLAANIHNGSVNCWKAFQGPRTEVKGQSHSLAKCNFLAEVYPSNYGHPLSNREHLLCEAISFHALLEGFQSPKLKVNITARTNTLLQQRHIFQWCNIVAYPFLFRCYVSILVLTYSQTHLSAYT